MDAKRIHTPRPSVTFGSMFTVFKSSARMREVQIKTMYMPYILLSRCRTATKYSRPAVVGLSKS